MGLCFNRSLVKKENVIMVLVVGFILFCFLYVDSLIYLYFLLGF